MNYPPAAAQPFALQLVGVGTDGRDSLQALLPATLGRAEVLPPLFLDALSLKRSEAIALANADLIVVACANDACHAPLIRNILGASSRGHPIVLVAVLPPAGGLDQGTQPLATGRPGYSEVTHLSVGNASELALLLRGIDAMISIETAPNVDFADLRAVLKNLVRAELACIARDLPAKPKVLDRHDDPLFEAAVAAAVARTFSTMKDRHGGRLPERLAIQLCSGRAYSVATMTLISDAVDAASADPVADGYLVLGLGYDPALGDRLELTVIGGNKERELPAAAMIAEARSST